MWSGADEDWQKKQKRDGRGLGERMIDMARIETFDLRSRRIGHTDDILVDR